MKSVPMSPNPRCEYSRGLNAGIKCGISRRQAQPAERERERVSLCGKIHRGYYQTREVRVNCFGISVSLPLSLSLRDPSDAISN